jgi:hypothetical protein
MANDGRGGRVTPHPPELRARALDLASEYGPNRAADMLDLSPNTLKSWMKRRAAKSHRELTRQGLVMPVRANVPWAARRNELLASLAELAEESVAAARLAVSEGRSKAASEFSSVASRSLDKAALLGGDVTSRSESRSLAMHLESPGLAAVKAEGRAIAASGEVQLERAEGDGRDG